MPIYFNQFSSRRCTCYQTARDDRMERLWFFALDHAY